MARLAFLMRLKDPSVIDRYVELHRDIGAEVEAAHRRAGFRNYSIFRSGLDLFAFFEADDPQATMENIAKEPVMERWWALTGPLMETDEQGRPRATVIDEVFHMD